MKKISVILGLTLVVVHCSQAELRTNIEYTVAGGESLKLDFFVPEGTGPFPTAVLVHGGGWRNGNKQVYITPIFRPLTEAGYAWCSIDYRLAPTHRYPAAVDDVVTAIKWVQAHASEYKVDVKRMALIGESAGGHLVALVGARDGKRFGLAAVVPFYAPCELETLAAAREKSERASTALGTFFGFTELNDQARRLLREGSPVTYVSKDMPPFLLIHGDKDTTVPFEQSVVMRDRMKQAGAVCELYTVTGGAHGMGGWEKQPELQGYKAEMMKWLKGRLGK